MRELCDEIMERYEESPIASLVTGKGHEVPTRNGKAKKPGIPGRKVRFNETHNIAQDEPVVSEDEDEDTDKPSVSRRLAGARTTRSTMNTAVRILQRAREGQRDQLRHTKMQKRQRNKSWY